MTKREYLDELKAQLYFLSESDRDEVVREFESHIDDTAAQRRDLREEELVDRLPPPASVAARYHAESSGEAMGREGEEKRRGWDGFTLDDLGSMFRYARSEERELSGSAEGIERVEVEGIACDMNAKLGEAFSYRVRGRWDEKTEPVVSKSGGAWRIDCGRDADRLELVLPGSVAEVVVKSLSGDLSMDLPTRANLVARLVSGDVSCKAADATVAIVTASGDVSVGGSPLDVDVRTASGDVQIRGAEGDVSVASQSGDLSVRDVSGRGELALQTMSGDVSVSLPADASPEIYAQSVSGDVSALGQSTERGNVGKTLRVSGGPGSVHAKSVSGDVSIR